MWAFGVELVREGVEAGLLLQAVLSWRTVLRSDLGDGLIVDPCSLGVLNVRLLQIGFKQFSNQVPPLLPAEMPTMQLLIEYKGENQSPQGHEPRCDPLPPRRDITARPRASSGQEMEQVLAGDVEAMRVNRIVTEVMQ